MLKVVATKAVLVGLTVLALWSILVLTNRASWEQGLLLAALMTVAAAAVLLLSAKRAGSSAGDR